MIIGFMGAVNLILDQNYSNGTDGWAIIILSC